MVIPFDDDDVDEEEMMGGSPGPLETICVHGSRPIPFAVLAGQQYPQDFERDAIMLEAMLSTALPKQTLLHLYQILTGRVQIMLARALKNEQHDKQEPEWKKTLVNTETEEPAKEEDAPKKKRGRKRKEEKKDEEE